MIETFRQYLSTAWSHAARALDANRRRFMTFSAGAVGAVVAVPVFATPARVVARAPAATRQTLGYRETDHIRHYYRSARL
ncbi:MAG TPA: formate dehydrogenase [Casimicrobiaceae bacterium]